MNEENKFKSKQGHLRAGCPYRLTNNNFGFYFPRRLYGLTTNGRKCVFDLKTKDLYLAQARIDAMALVLRLASSKGNF